MTKVTYVHPTGAQNALDVSAGTSVMAAAVAEGIDGIVGDCGGNLMCATCHVYVAPDHVDQLPAISEDEDALLDDTASERRANSRLGCQLVMSDAVKELRVEMPPEQI